MCIRDSQGFDRFYGYNCQRHAHSYYPNYLWSNLKRVPLNNEPPVPGHASLPKGADPADPRSYDVFKGKDYAPDRINEQALKFIRDHKEKPFFLYYPTVIPHVALHVPDEELKPYLAQKWNDPPFVRARGYGYTPHFSLLLKDSCFLFSSALRLRRSFFHQPRSVSTPLPRRRHRSQFILPTPLPGARYSLRLAIPSSLCLSYHSARPELQCGYPPFTAG